MKLQIVDATVTVSTEQAPDRCLGAFLKPNQGVSISKNNWKDDVRNTLVLSIFHTSPAS